MSDGILKGNRGIARPPAPPRRVLRTTRFLSAKKNLTWLTLFCIVAIILLSSATYLAIIQKQNPSASSTKTKERKDKIEALGAKLLTATNDKEAEKIIAEIEKEEKALENDREQDIKSEKGAVKIGDSFEVATKDTKFSVMFTGAWFSDKKLGEKNKKEFLVAYSYKNLGPREYSFHMVSWKIMIDPSEKTEIYTKDGRIFSGSESHGNRLFDDWKYKEAKEVSETGEKALAFEIPENAVPEKIVVQRDDGYTFILRLTGNSFPTKQERKNPNRW